jgi:hypothetical protein
MDSYRYYCVPGTQQPRPRFDANTKAISLFAPLYCTVIISTVCSRGDFASPLPITSLLKGGLLIRACFFRGAFLF